MGLAVPLWQLQIDAANRLHEQLSQWQVTDRALYDLHTHLPAFTVEATLLKVAAVNQLYGTNVYAVDRMARHIFGVLQAKDNLDSVGLVEMIATLPERTHTSFASKFAHFFIDKERFPIYDSFAEQMIAFHIGSRREIRHKGHPYRAFVQNLATLRELAGSQLSCTNVELDRYLWLAGLYKAYKTKANPRINHEVEELFTSLSLENAPSAMLHAMLPSEFATLQRRKPRLKAGKEQRQ
jgi:hypothetical protein